MAATAAGTENESANTSEHAEGTDATYGNTGSKLLRADSTTSKGADGTDRTDGNRVSGILNTGLSYV